jgi:DNA-directed RNA polymerase subunit RPC12/RpoP
MHVRLIDSATVCNVGNVMPPTLRELLRNDTFRQFMKTRPRLPEHLLTGDPWMVWAKTTRNTWINPRFATYDLAWKQSVAMMRDVDEYADISLISRRVLMPPPAYLLPLMNEYEMLGFEWCGRCRRPTKFKLSTSRHHAVRGFPTVTEDDPVRCYYCGQRQVSNIYPKR